MRLNIPDTSDYISNIVVARKIKDQKRMRYL